MGLRSHAGCGNDKIFSDVFTKQRLETKEKTMKRFFPFLQDTARERAYHSYAAPLDVLNEMKSPAASSGQAAFA
jgi:hypothetical protein